MTSPGIDANGWRRFLSLGVLVVVAGVVSAVLGLPLPTTLQGWIPVVAVTLAGLAVWAWVLPRLLRPFGPRLLLLAVVGLASGWFLLSPLFMDREVNEALPGLPAADAPAAQPAADPAQPAPEDGAAGDQAPQDAAPTRLAAGTLAGIGHSAAGGVALYELADGSRVVRLEDVDIQNGPDLFVYLVPEPGQSDDAGGVNLGRLKGNMGSANYPVPADVDTDDYATVLIWCRAFSTPFANATLTDA
jgi:hypothetical protein